MPVRIDANMKIQVVVYSTTAVSVNVAYRESINGEMRQPRQANIVSSRITTDAAANYFYFTMAGTPTNPSELQNVVVGLATASVQRGQCFVRVGITIGGTDGTASDPIQVLFSDYVTSNSYLAFPSSEIKSSLDGKGYLSIIHPNDPAAGLSLVYTFVPNLLSLIYSCVFTLTTSAAVANRKAKVFYEDAVSQMYLGIASGVQTASTTVEYKFTPNVSANETSLITNKTFLECLSYPVFVNNDISTFYILVENMDAADQLSGIELYCEEWIK